MVISTLKSEHAYSKLAKHKQQKCLKNITIPNHDKLN